MSLKLIIQQLALSYSEEFIQLRRHLHANPELSFEEYQTSAFISDYLTQLGIKHTTQIAGTGIIAIIEGKNPHKKNIALRADMDALPIQEANEVDYKSKNDGIMHACGHDVHTASLLGCAKILSEIKDQFEGSVKLIFQPGEEKLPGGASLMIKEKALENPSSDSILGQHVAPSIPVGKVGFREGMYMASCDELYITITGKGGHAAMPEKLIDPILIAANIIVSLQQIISRNCDPKIPAVLSFGRIEGLGATNIIPNEVKIQGTFRTLNEQWRAEAHLRMVKMATAIAHGMGAECDFQILNGYPFLKNNPELTSRMKAGAEEYLGKENVLDLDLYMAAEDFSYYTQLIDACFYRLGVRNEQKGITSGVHTTKFDIDENALKIGSGLMAWLTIRELMEEAI
ncbi:MAG: amidohydrolase [Cytophagales bacterium]|nr:MAG: amidohydrolase [Cytophagales bacterium]